LRVSQRLNFIHGVVSGEFIPASGLNTTCASVKNDEGKMRSTFRIAKAEFCGLPDDEITDLSSWYQEKSLSSLIRGTDCNTLESIRQLLKNYIQECSQCDTFP
jgi:hypothetical protein